MSDPHWLARGMEDLPVGVIVYRGPQHVVASANRAARAFFGNRRNLVGLPIAQAYAEDGGHHVLAILDKVYAAGERFSATEWRILVDRCCTTSSRR